MEPTINAGCDASTLKPASTYRRRFAQSAVYRANLWRILCRDFFQHMVPSTATVVEIAAGHCEFINAIQAAHKVAVDINPDTRQHAGSGVEVHLCSSTNLASICDGRADVVFTSNYFEHLTKPDIVVTLKEIWRILKPGGKLIVLQPNIRFAFRDYWMFFDHVTPLDDRAICEVLELTGFEVTQCVPQFLPYSTQSKLPKALILVRLYLRLPFLWRWIGKQALMVALRKPSLG